MKTNHVLRRFKSKSASTENADVPSNPPADAKTADATIANKVPEPNPTEVKLSPRGRTGSARARRRGAGQIRHLETETLWFQHKMVTEELRVRRGPGVTNVADLGTKRLDRATMERHLESLGFIIVSARAPFSLTADLT